MTSTLELRLYPSDHGFIGRIVLDDRVLAQKQNEKPLSSCGVSTIVVLDRSGSMGNSVPRLVNKILPNMFRSLDYENNERITLITFDSSAQKYQMTVKEMHSFSIRCQGQTMMTPAIRVLMDHIRNEVQNKSQAIRLLTISDGEVQDPDNVQTEASRLASLIKNDYIINSQAVRFFTSSAQPDTRAVSSLLQLNNSSQVRLLDLRTQLSDDEISMTIASLFSKDSLHQHTVLQSKQAVFKLHPWQEKASETISLFPGENLFWIKEIPDDQLFIGNIPVNISLSEQLTMVTYEKLLRSKIDHYMNQLKILKVINTKESQTEMNEILTYFQTLETNLCSNEEDVKIIVNDSSLRARLQYLKLSIERKKKSFVMRMAQIANDDKVSQLNSAQQAEYLRSVDSSSKNARGLARRAVTQGLDFNEKLRQEVRTMAKYIDQLKDINDDDHLVSFYSQDTTLGGIRAVCQLVNDDLIDDLDANEILKMINIVGVACSGPIGEFPDPMTWRVNQIHIGCYVSLSDVLTGFLQSKGRPLLTPATNHQIDNVIPIFEEPKIIHFLKKYAPSLLEYTASIGMRRLIADVPMTAGYTVCAAVWKLIEDLNTNKTQLHLQIFEQVLKTYELLVGNYFQHIMAYLKQQEGPYSYYIANNGVTNMISPLMNLLRENNSLKLQEIPKILRALYTYEIWQGIRRQYKNRDDSDQIPVKMLDRLIGLDLDLYKTKVRPVFEPEPDLSEIQFHDKIHLDEKYLDELLGTVRYVDYLTLLPTYLLTVINSDREALKNIPSMNEETIRQALNIDYPLREFQFHNVVQALIFTTKASRVDSDRETMKILDLVDRASARRVIQDYVRKRFENQYASDLSVKTRQERTEMVSNLVKSILSSHQHEQMIELLRDGLKHDKLHVAITNSSSLGFVELKEKMLDLNEQVPRRLDLIKVFLLGRDYKNNDEPVWNNGNVLFTPDFERFAQIFITLGYQDQWDLIKNEYMKRNLHIYRDGFNRHGHGNTKPSYWAFGFPTLEKYMEHISPEMFEEYCRIHVDCCGTQQLKQFLDKTKPKNK